MTTNEIPYKIYLHEHEMPTDWYNVRADMPTKPAPLLNPGTLQPMTAEELGAVFCDELVAQELNDTDRFIPIPEAIRTFYKMYRPSPLVRAYCLEERLGTPAKIYYKFEGNNTSGSHKLNSAIAQAYYAHQQGTRLARDYLRQYRGAEYGDTGLPFVTPGWDVNQAVDSIVWAPRLARTMISRREATPEETWHQITSALVGRSMREALRPGRETIIQSAEAAGSWWRRVSDGNPCAFCAGRTVKAAKS